LRKVGVPLTEGDGTWVLGNIMASENGDSLYHGEGLKKPALDLLLEGEK